MDVDVSDKPALREAIDRITTRLAAPIEPAVLDSYLAGSAQDVSYYDKITTSRGALPALTRMLLVAESFLAQPDLHTYYDIFRAARYVPLTRALDIALQIVEAHTKGFEPRLQRLVAAQDLDVLEATIFELAVAARYAIHPDVRAVMFIPETSSPSPDLEVDLSAQALFVECKKFDRVSDAGCAIRDRVVDVTNQTVSEFAKTKISAVVELTIKVDPDALDEKALAQDVNEALLSGGAVVGTTTTVIATRIAPIDLRAAYKLIPSPDYFWNQYQYTPARPWHGFIAAERARMAGPSWIDELSWVFGIKWAVVDGESVWKRKKFGFARLLKGLDQLSARGPRTVLHVCYDRTEGLGPRDQELRRFIGEVADKEKQFSWVVFNELVLDVSLKGGRFDFREHAHTLVGPNRFGSDPPVTLVFVPGEGIAGPPSQFGVGVSLPPLD
jgi:hypothetical protein